MSPSQKRTDSSDGVVGDNEGTSMTEIWPFTKPGVREAKGSIDLRVPGVMGANFEEIS